MSSYILEKPERTNPSAEMFVLILIYINFHEYKYTYQL